MDEDFERLLVTPKYPPPFGGSPRQSFELIQQLSDRARIHTILLKGSCWKPLFFACVKFFTLAKCIANPNIGFVRAGDGLMAAVLTSLCWVTSKEIILPIHRVDLFSGIAGFQVWEGRPLPGLQLVGLQGTSGPPATEDRKEYWQ